MSRGDARIIRIRRADRLGWMTTFSDMVTLLLTFFVMIIAMSSMDRKSLENAFGFFRSVAGPLHFPSRGAIDVRPDVAGPIPRIMELNRQALYDRIVKELAKRPPQPLNRGLDFLEVAEADRGLVIRLSGDVLFEEGSSRIGAQGERILSAVAEVLMTTQATISVEGHTDGRGGEDANRVLSLERAVGVMEYMVYKLHMPSSRFCVAGYGMHRPIATNDTETGRQKNRRVEIVLLKDRF